MTFKIGVIGAGNHGIRYLRHAARDVPGMAVAGLSRRDEGKGKALASDLGCRYHRESASLLADPEVDGVVVCTPPSSHFRLACQTLEQGKPLLLEKPMTGTLGEAEQLLKTDSVASCPLMVAQTLRWNPVILKVKELWPRLGRVRLIRIAQRLAPTSLPWQRDRSATVGGSVLLTGVHIFDTVRFLTGSEFAQVDSRQESVLNPVVEDLFLARATLANGCWASMEVSKFTQSRACWLEAVGEDGQIWADYQQGGIKLRIGSQEESFATSATVPTLPGVLADWLASVRCQTPPPVTIRDGLATIQVADACYRSARTGQAVTL